MLDLCSELGQLAAATLRQAFPDSPAIPTELAVVAASRPEFGDLQIAGCLQLGKPLGKKPRELAQLIVDKLGGHPALAKVELAGAGYVNLYLQTGYIEAQLRALAQDPHHGIRQRFTGQAVVVDYSSPNIAKPMHIGHIRSTIIGAALCRILAAVGYTIIADNHLGDWGTQFGKLIVAYRHWRDPQAFAATPINELVRLYQKFVSDEKLQAEQLGLKKPPRQLDGPGSPPPDAEPDSDGEEEAELATPLLREARAELAKLQSGDSENLRLWQEFVSVSLREFAKTYQRLGVSFDVQLGESFYNPRLASLVDELVAAGIAEPSRGAIICNIEGEASPLLIRKADGSFLYGTTDIATVEYRVKTWQPVRILYVVGSPQQLHFRQLFAIARRLGVGCSLEHISFGAMRFRDEQGAWTTGSTRKGNVPLLDEFIDEAIRRAAGVAAGKNAELGADELAEVARVVGIGAIKYNDLARDRSSDIHFDLDKALALDGNTAPYIQYAYARLRSIARRAQAEGATVAPAPQLTLPGERALGRRLLDYGAAVERSAETARPHSLCEYLYELAGAVSTFYNEVPVLKAEADERAARLALLALTAQTLRHGLSLLGIEVPERM
jgi:arginyl-tRNA synthetase